MTLRHWVWLCVVSALPSCGGGSADHTPPDFAERDRETVDADRVVNATDQPTNASEVGSDAERPLNATDPVLIYGEGEGGRDGGGGRATGGRATGGRPAVTGGSPSGPSPTGGRGGRGGGGPAGTGGRTATTGGSSEPVPATCNPQMGCECGSNACAACECNYGADAPICDGDCN